MGWKWSSFRLLLQRACWLLLKLLVLHFHSGSCYFLVLLLASLNCLKWIENIVPKFWYQYTLKLDYKFTPFVTYLDPWPYSFYCLKHLVERDHEQQIPGFDPQSRDHLHTRPTFQNYIRVQELAWAP